MLQRGYRPIHAERNVANQFLIRGKLNGARCVFDVDTGAACTLVDMSKATQLKRVTSLGSLRGAFGFEAKDVPVVAIDCMDLGGTIISNQLMGVLNLHRDRTVYTGSYIPRTDLFNQKDVLLGLDFLVDTHAFVDCSGVPTIYLRDSPASQQLAESMDASFKQSGFDCVPLRATPGKLFVKVWVNEKEADFILDTGAGSTDLDLSQLEKFQIGAREVIGTVRDIGANRAELRYATIRSLKIGAYEQQNFHAAVDELQFLKPKPGQDPRVILGLLGPDLLGKAQALIDCSRAKLYLKPLPSK